LRNQTQLGRTRRMKYIDEKPYREFRCSRCRTLLAMEYIYAGRLEIKCHACNEMNRINFKTTKNELKKVLSSDLKGGENK